MRLLLGFSSQGQFLVLHVGPQQLPKNLGRPHKANECMIWRSTEFRFRCRNMSYGITSGIFQISAEKLEIFSI
jgi:hypothetical protein